MSAPDSKAEMLRAALLLLRRAAAALEEECEAAGPDEVKQHQTLRAHKRLAKEIRKHIAAEHAAFAKRAYGALQPPPGHWKVGR